MNSFSIETGLRHGYDAIHWHTFPLLEIETLLRVFRAKEKSAHVELILIEDRINRIHTGSHPYHCFSNGQN